MNVETNGESISRKTGNAGERTEDGADFHRQLDIHAWRGALSMVSAVKGYCLDVGAMVDSKGAKEAVGVMRLAVPGKLEGVVKMLGAAHRVDLDQYSFDKEFFLSVCVDVLEKMQDNCLLSIITSKEALDCWSNRKDVVITDL